MTNEEFIESIRLEGEEWRPVAGWGNYYMVSSLGRVLSLDRQNTRKNGTKYSVKKRLLKLNRTKHNGILYDYVCFRKNCDRTVVAVHRLVAIAFLPNTNNYSEVDHIDRNGTNNSVSNLRWCNRSMNMRNEKTKIVFSLSQRKKHLPTLYKPVIQLKENNIINVFESITEAGKSGYSTGAITSVCKGKRNFHKGFKWMYLSEYEASCQSNNVKELSPMQ